MPPTRPPDRAAAARRDAGLMRVSRLTRWLLAGALALTAVFSTIAARISGATGNHSATTSSSRSSGSDEGSSSDDGSTSGSGSTDSGSNLQAPGSVPFPSGGSGNVTSGGS